MERIITKENEILKNHLIKDTSNDIVIIEFGGNDYDSNWEEVYKNPNLAHIPSTLLDLFETQLYKMIARLKKLEIQPILMTLPPLHTKRYFQIIMRNELKLKIAKLSCYTLEKRSVCLFYNYKK